MRKDSPETVENENRCFGATIVIRSSLVSSAIPTVRAGIGFCGQNERLLALVTVTAFARKVLGYGCY